MNATGTPDASKNTHQTPRGTRAEHRMGDKEPWPFYIASPKVYAPGLEPNYEQAKTKGEQP